MTAYRIDIIESERGWGRKIDSREYFKGKDALAKAKAFQAKFNSQNTSLAAPDWYMQAEDPVLIPDENVPPESKKRKRK